MRNLLNNRFSILFLFSIFTLFSCSKDSDDPNPFEITVTTSDFSITMDENPENEQVIGTVSGSTSAGSVTFLLIEQTPANAFTIDPASGELKVLNKVLFDFEKNPTITGTVKVYNGIISEDASVTITLNDLNEGNIFKGDVFLRSQQEVNDFGANNYTDITGNLLVGRLENEGYSDIHDLSPLNTLEKIDGHLYFDYNGDLTTTAGLENLTFMGGYLGFIDNPSLIKIEGLNSIAKHISGGLVIVGNDLLNNLDGINQIATIEEYIWITSNPEISNLNWLGNLVSVKKDLRISGLRKLQNFNALSSLESIGGLSVGSCPLLINFEGLQNLNSTIKWLSINNNNSLTSLSGLENINIEEGIVLTLNNSLSNINALTRVTNLTSSINIYENDALNDLTGLNNLLSVGESIKITSNDNLISLNGFENLLNVSYALEITDNRKLTDFCAIQNLFINGNVGYYTVFSNAYNPSKQNIIDGNCSL